MASKQEQDGTEELHKALRASKEISQTWTLHQFVSEVSEMGAKIPNFETIHTDEAFGRFLRGIILCAEAGHDRRALEAAIAQPENKKLAKNYVDLLHLIVFELIKAGKGQHLLTNGYEISRSGASDSPVEPREINLNKAQLVTKMWERVHGLLGDSLFAHIVKNFLIFTKTRDHSLVQLSGTNVWAFFSERPGPG